jgi:spore maturation protein SpmA
MKEMDKQNKGISPTFPMLLLFMLNLSGLSLIPTTVIGLRATYQSANPADIFLPNLIVTTLNTLIAIALAFIFSKKERRQDKIEIKGKRLGVRGFN